MKQYEFLAKWPPLHVKNPQIFVILMRFVLLCQFLKGHQIEDRDTFFDMVGSVVMKWKERKKHLDPNQPFDNAT